MWLIILAITLLIELLTTSLITIWFAIGSLCALLFSWIGVSLTIQIVVFVIVSFSTLILTKPFVQKKLLPESKIEKTNMDELLEKTGIVTVEISNSEDKGEILLEGKFWTARTKGNEVIPVNAKVNIVAIEGVTVFVSKREKSEEESSVV